MSSPLEMSTGKDSISSRLGAVNFETPVSGNLGPQTPNPEDTSFGNSDSLPIQKVARHKITPKTVAPKIPRVQREREKAAKLAQQSSGLFRSGDTTRDTTPGDIIIHLNADAEYMNSSVLRKNSKGRIIKPTEDDDVFTAPSMAQGKTPHWMYRRIGEKTDSFPDSVLQGRIEGETPTRDPKNKGPQSSKNLEDRFATEDTSEVGFPGAATTDETPPKEGSLELGPLVEEHLEETPRENVKLGIPFPNFGKFWCSKYDWEEVQGTYLAQMFELCDPADEVRVKELYDLAWVIKLSTAMVQCDISDPKRIKQLVQWAQDFRNKDDWQCSVPLGWSVHQIHYRGPKPSDEERQRFVDYAWYMDYCKVRQAWDPDAIPKYKEAAHEVSTFKEKYPDFPHDFPAGYHGVHPMPVPQHLRPNFKSLEEKGIYPARGEKRKIFVAEEEETQHGAKKQKKVTAKAKSAANPTEPRRSNRNKKK